MPYPTRNSLIATFLGCAAGLFLFSGSASAQTEVFVTNGYLGNANTPIDFQVPSFNTDLGTLDAVDITLQYNLCPVITIDNTTSAPIKFENGLVTVPLTVDAPGATDYNVNLVGDVDINSPKNAPVGVSTYAPSTFVRNFGSETVASNALNLWEDQPNNTITFVSTPGAATATATTFAQGLNLTGTATEWGQITVEYVYTGNNLATPEPRGAYLTAIVGLAMVIGVFQRRKTTLAI